MKYLLAASGMLLLTACGGNTRVPVQMDNVVAANAPWLTVEESRNVVPVSGLERSVKIEPTPTISGAVEAQLRQQLKSKYSTDLIVRCRDVEASMAVDTDQAPGTISMQLATSCRINARGSESSHNYRARESVPATSNAEGVNYQAAFPQLVAITSKEIAGNLATDIVASNKR